MTTLIASLIASLIAAQCLWVRGQASRHRGDGGGDRGGARELEVARAAPGAARQVRPCLKKGRRPPCVPPPPTPTPPAASIKWASLPLTWGAVYVGQYGVWCKVWVRPSLYEYVL